MTTPPNKTISRWRRIKASWRDTWLLLRQFSWPLLAFCVAITGGGTIYYALARLAAPAFAAAGAGLDMTPPIVIEGEALSLARLNISPTSRLIEQKVCDVEGKYELSIVLLRKKDETDFHPKPDRCLEAGDVLAVLGNQNSIGQLMQDNR